MAIDNKLITMHAIAGYSVEPVVSLWYEQKFKERTKNYGKQTQTAR